MSPKSNPAYAAGTIHPTMYYGDVEVLDYQNTTKIHIRFVETGYEKWVATKELGSGSIRDNTLEIRTKKRGSKHVQVGDVYTSNNYGDFKVLEYNGFRKVTIQFITTGTIITTVSTQVDARAVADPYLPKYYGVGYLGEGQYNTDHPAHTIWSSMLYRCSSGNEPITYTGVTVEDHWHNFQNFARFYDLNYVDGYHLDKDLLDPRSKIYSRATCCFIPQRINALLTDHRNDRGDHPTGVHLEKGSQKFIAQINKNDTRVNLGRYCTPKEARAVYLREKAKYIRQVAKQALTTGQILDTVYTNLMQWDLSRDNDGKLIDNDSKVTDKD